MAEGPTDRLREPTLALLVLLICTVLLEVFLIGPGGLIGGGCLVQSPPPIPALAVAIYLGTPFAQLLAGMLILRALGWRGTFARLVGAIAYSALFAALGFVAYVVAFFYVYSNVCHLPNPFE